MSIRTATNRKTRSTTTEGRKQGKRRITNREVRCQKVGIIERKERGPTIKKYKCEKEGCCKWYVHHSDMLRHKTRHDLTKQNKSCETCGKAFWEEAALKTHINSHTNKRPHVCRIIRCGKTFNDPSSLNRHERDQHGPIQRYVCSALTSKCSTGIARLADFKKHWRVKHDHILTREEIKRCAVLRAFEPIPISADDDEEYVEEHEPVHPHQESLKYEARYSSAQSTPELLSSQFSTPRSDSLLRTPSPFELVQPLPQDQNKLAAYIVDGCVDMMSVDPQLYPDSDFGIEYQFQQLQVTSSPMTYPREELALPIPAPFGYDDFSYLSAPSWSEPSLTHSPAYCTAAALSPHSKMPTPLTYDGYSPMEYTSYTTYNSHLAPPVAWDAQIPKTPEPPSHGYVDFSVLGLVQG